MKKNNLKVVKIDKNKSLFNYEKKILINDLILDLKLGVSMVQIGEKDQGCKMINGVEKQYPQANQSVIQKAKYESKKFECANQDS